MKVVVKVVFQMGMLMLRCSVFLSAVPLDPTTISPSVADDPLLPTDTIHFPDKPGEHNLNQRILIPVIVASTLICGFLLCLSCFWIYRWKILHNSKTQTQHCLEASKGISLVPELDTLNSSRRAGKKASVAVIDYQLLVAATNNFSDDKILGGGGGGQVYKALFSDQLVAAVKRLHGEGPTVESEFENEVAWLGKIQHQNVISLLFYCVHGETRFLVYEMMQNGSLESQLHGPSQGLALTWHLRMKIALDVARGLEYLHEHCNPPLIHRDIKSSNILLDSCFNAKISDFGLAVADGNLNKSNVKLSGTLGYVAPEYLLDGKLTDRSDVYAFGVILLELLTGRKAVDEISESQCQSIVSWAMPQLTDRSKLPDIIDPVIRDTMELKHLYQVAAVAVLCIQPEPSYRPLITDVLHSFIPLVPVDLGGSRRLTKPTVPPACA